MSCPPHRPTKTFTGEQVCADCGQPVKALHLTPGEAAAVEHVRRGGSFQAPQEARHAPGTANREDRYDAALPPADPTTTPKPSPARRP